MDEPKAILGEPSISLTDVYTASDVYRIGSKSSILAMERAGKFPKRFYLAPKRPAWNKLEVDHWVSKRAQNGDESRLDASQLGIRLIRAKQLGKSREAS